MRLYRIVYAAMTSQAPVVVIDHGDRCIRVDTAASPAEQAASLAEAVMILQASRIKIKKHSPYPDYAV